MSPKKQPALDFLVSHFLVCITAKVQQTFKKILPLTDILKRRKV
jgi:hypothetical protein